MYESDEIVKYLFNNYGDGKVPWGLSLGIFTALSCGFALIPRYYATVDSVLESLGPLHSRCLCIVVCAVPAASICCTRWCTGCYQDVYQIKLIPQALYMSIFSCI